MKKLNLSASLILILFVVLISSCTNRSGSSEGENLKYQPDWESLSQWTMPQWFNDAVLGIYCHWGVYSVPGYRFNSGAEEVDSGLWYGWFMYVTNESGEENYGVYDFHREHYGDPSEFPYHDFIPLFRAENWDPDRWATLYKKAGADFAGIAAEHGDGFILWDSDFDKFNAKDMGPKRDLLGELFEAVRKQDMKTVATFHERPGEMFEVAREFHPRGEGANDPAYSELYDVPSFERQNNKLLEVVDKYRPDQIWFEDEYCGPKNWKTFIAYYYNAADSWSAEVFISQKHDMAPLSCSVFDIEGGIFPDGVWEWAGMTEPQEQRWQKDVPIGKFWAYAEGVGCRPVNMLVDGIVDRISKNGVTLLDVAPKADGTLPEAQVRGLEELGKWMDVNKEALYAARPAPFTEGGIDAWQSGSIRFTEKENFLYAIELGNTWPPKVGFDEYGESKKPEAPYFIPGVNPLAGSDIFVLGYDKSLPWHMEGDKLVIEDLPEDLPGEHAWSFKIKMK